MPSGGRETDQYSDGPIIRTMVGIKRDLTYALLISFGIHIFGMSAVAIIIPGGAERLHSYTRVDFLGPILRKTAFDIMLENTPPPVITAYGYANISPETKLLGVRLPKKESSAQLFNKPFEDKMDIRVRGFLADYKVVPDLTFALADGERLSVARRVLYKPEAPFIIKGLYGDKENFTVRIKTLLDAGGNVKKAELVTTTGYPKLDIIISEFVKSWIFAPSGNPSGDEWQETEVVLKTM